MKKKVTITDIATRCNVSKSSVSRYLNNGYVSKENAEKIRAAIEETGFETNYFASRLKAKRSRLIGIIVSDIAQYECARTLNGMQHKLNAQGYQGVILLGENDVEKERNCIKSFAQQGVDGIIIERSDHVDELKEQIDKYGVPVLFANRTCTYAPFLDLEEKKAGILLGSYFVERGYQKFVYLQHDDTKGLKRKEGFLHSYEEKGKTCSFDVMSFDGSLQGAYDIARLLAGQQYDAIICERDEHAISVMKHFHEFHIHVPQNIAVATFGGNEIAKMCSPGITTLAFAYDTFGENLVEEMIAIIESRAPEWADVKLTLIERESVKSL